MVTQTSEDSASGVWHNHSADRPGLQAAAQAIHPGQRRTPTPPGSGIVGGGLGNAPSATSTQAGRTTAKGPGQEVPFPGAYTQFNSTVTPKLQQQSHIPRQEGPLLLCLVHSRHLTITGNSWNNYSISKTTKLRLRS